jgi:hypothetical protein
MAIELDHFIVPSHNRIASAKLLAELLGVAWRETVLGIFSPVYINNGLTLDFVQTDEDYPVHHYCFRVSPNEFDTILERIKVARIDYRSTVRGPVDFQVDTQFGGKGVYWNEPDGHQWEMLTVSYARQP